MEISIRAADHADERRIDEIVTAAFGQADEAVLIHRLRQQGDLAYALVAAVNGVVTGHIAASPIRLEPDQGLNCLGIAPLSVDPAQQSKGVGSALMRATISQAKIDHTDALFLLGNPDYYHRFGFVTATVGNSYGASDAFMQLCLRTDCLSGVSAHAHYSPAFAQMG